MEAYDRCEGGWILHKSCPVNWLVLQLVEILEMWAIQTSICCGCFITLNTLGYQTKLGLFIRKYDLDISFYIIDLSQFLALRLPFCYCDGCGLQSLLSMQSRTARSWRSLGVGSFALLCVSNAAKLVFLMLFVVFQAAAWRRKKKIKITL